MEKQRKEIIIVTQSIPLDKFLKWAGISETGGSAKYVIQNELVTVNGEVEKKRSRVLLDGDTVCVSEDCYVVKYQKQD
jgi:ribosome-associated protein